MQVLSDAKFEVVSKYQEAGINLPVRKTANSAGYDFEAAENIIIPSMSNLMKNQTNCVLYLSDAETLSKQINMRPTLVPTGVKCKLPEGYYLELSARSSLPLKSWLILGNGVGVIDSDYYNSSPDDEGHIYFQLINLSPWDIFIEKGTAIGQGIIKSYCVTEDDNATAARVGGFGSTDQ